MLLVTSLLTILAFVVYLVGVGVVSWTFNVPMNDRLEALSPDSAEAQHYWKTVYLPEWTLWNHVRVAASLATAILFLVASPSAT